MAKKAGPRRQIRLTSLTRLTPALISPMKTRQFRRVPFTALPMSPESLPVKQRLVSHASLLAIGFALAVTLSACGRRGALEPPPGTSQAPAMTQQELAGRSTSGGSATFRPARETDTGQQGFVTGEAPPAPVLMQQQMPNTNPQGEPTVNSAAAAGLRTPGRGPRRSPPPKTPFILDPLL